MITEDQLEQLAISWFQATGWGYAHPGSSPGQAPPDIAIFRLYRA
jgi:hypothetical protein